MINNNILSVIVGIGHTGYFCRYDKYNKLLHFILLRFDQTVRLRLLIITYKL